MQVGRNISPRDKEIFKELLYYYPKDRIKLDRDIMSEPALYYRFYGEWEMVYKLSKDGDYIRDRWSYVMQAHNAIQQYCKRRWNDYRRNKIDYKEEAKAIEDTKIAQKRFADEGFKDNLPTE